MAFLPPGGGGAKVLWNIVGNGTGKKASIPETKSEKDGVIF
jgi:hypothetical protein